VRHEEAAGGVNLGRERAEEGVPRRPELHGGGNGGAAGSVRARGAPGGLFIDKRGNGGSLVP
jgi:hypothetical protein